MQHNAQLELAHVMWSRRRPMGGADTQQPPHQPPPATQCGGALPLLVLLTTALATGFYRFLARFSGRRRAWSLLSRRSGPPWALLVLAATSLLHITEACSSRTTPKPRPPAPTQRPNITFHTYVCPPAYATWYCLNGATCFTVKIGESLLYNCECADGYMGPRCEYKDLDGSYLPSQRRYMLETASIAGGATIAVFLVVILCIVVYVHFKRKAKQTRSSGTDCVDGGTHVQRVPTFGTRPHTRPLQRTGQDLPLNDRGDDCRPPPPVDKEQLQHVTTLLHETAGENLA
ncbi:Keren [Carabus blaptoides fortunei]